jgi:hypothetical protein
LREGHGTYLRCGEWILYRHCTYKSSNPDVALKIFAAEMGVAWA